MEKIPKEKIDFLEQKARGLRITMLQMLHNAGSGHPGGSLSACDLMTALYYDVMKIDNKQPKAPERDRFILSKGHCCPILYAILADKGFFFFF